MNKVTGKKFELTNKEIVQLTGLPVLAKIPFDLKIQESLAAKTPVVIHKQKSPASIEFFKLASILTGDVYEPPKLSFFDRFSRIFDRLS